MSPDIIIAAMIVVPTVLLFVLRINAAFVFLSLCLGDVLVRFVGKDAAVFVGGAGSTIQQTDQYLQLGILLLPAVLTMLFMIRTVKKGHKKFLNILPALGVGLLGALLAVPLMSAGLSHAIANSGTWQKVLQLQPAIVLSSALLCLVFLWMQRPRHGGGEDKHGKKH